MTNYRKRSSKRRNITVIFLSLIGLLLLGAVLAGALTVYYHKSLEPVSKVQKTQIFYVKKGQTVKQIAINLDDQNLIRSAWAAQVYIHAHGLSDKMKAGTYALSPSESTQEIVRTITSGEVTTRLVTILPGRRIDQVRADLINSGFSPQQVDLALRPELYKDLPIMTIKPQNVNTLEGLLWPDSYQRDDNTLPEDIIKQSLIEMGNQLTAQIKAGFTAQGLNDYQGITLASVIIQEVSKPADQTQAAQVFLKRLKTGMKMGSDVTAFYGSIAAGQAPNLTYDTPYNTLINTGLPPTPISTVNQSSLYAAAYPASTDWLYFVAGDDGTTHFANTYEEHQQNTQKYCKKLCNL